MARTAVAFRAPRYATHSGVVHFVVPAVSTHRATAVARTLRSVPAFAQAAHHPAAPIECSRATGPKRGVGRRVDAIVAYLNVFAIFAHCARSFTVTPARNTRSLLAFVAVLYPTVVDAQLTLTRVAKLAARSLCGGVLAIIARPQIKRAILLERLAIIAGVADEVIELPEISHSCASEKNFVEPLRLRKRADVERSCGEVREDVVFRGLRAVREVHARGQRRAKGRGVAIHPARRGERDAGVHERAAREDLRREVVADVERRRRGLLVRGARGRFLRPRGGDDVADAWEAAHGVATHVRPARCARE